MLQRLGGIRGSRAWLRKICGNTPAVDAVGALRLKGPLFEGRYFDEVASAAPMYFQATLAHGGYGRAVAAALTAIEVDLVKDVPSRKPFLRLIMQVCKMLGPRKVKSQEALLTCLCMHEVTLDCVSVLVCFMFLR